MSAANPALGDASNVVTMKIVFEEGLTDNHLNKDTSDYNDQGPTTLPTLQTNNQFRSSINAITNEEEAKNNRQSNSNRNVQISGFVKSHKQLTIEQNMPIAPSGIRLHE